jgi:hypothetical protein
MHIPHKQIPAVTGDDADIECLMRGISRSMSSHNHGCAAGVTGAAALMFSVLPTFAVSPSNSSLNADSRP